MVANISKTLSPLQQRLLEGLALIPDWIPLCLIGDKKAPLGNDWPNRPYTKDEVREAIMEGATIQAKGKTYRVNPKGYGVITGRPVVINGQTVYLMAVDQDGSSAKELIQKLSDGEGLPETYAFTSNRPGRCQFLFTVSPEYASHLRTLKLKTGVKGDDGKEEQLELRWSNLQSVLPPSVHPETGCYRWVNSPEEVAICASQQRFAIAPAPMWVIEAMLAEPEPTHHEPERHPTSYTRKLRSGEEWSNEEWALSYLSALNSYRADNYVDWLAVGMALHSVSDLLLSEWDNWSRQSAKYKPGDCDKKWKSFNRKGVAIGSLAHMAKQDGWRSPFDKSTGRSFSGGIGSGGGSRGNGGSGGSSGDGGDGDGGERTSKVIKHPSFNPISPEVLETRLNALVQQGLTASKLTGQLNQLAEETGRHVIELRKQYSELLAEVEQKELRDYTAEQVELLLEASTAALDLHEILPSSLATPLLKLAGWLNLKPEAYLTALLTTVSVLHKVGTSVVLNQEWDFEVSPNLYSAIIAPSSQKKSPILKAICKKPLSLLQKQAHEQYKRQIHLYEEELKEWEATHPDERGPIPEKPQRKLYFFTKATGEGITYQAARCPEQGMLYLSDELAGMLSAQNQYRGGKGSDKQDLLTYYDGVGDVTLRADGVKSESDFVLLGIIGGIQPKVMQKLLDDCSDSDGEWARFLFVNQPNAASQMSADGGNYDLTNRLADLYRLLDALPPTTYRLSPEAFRLFCKAYTSLEKRRVSDRLEGMQAVWGKAEGRLGKFAVNLHVIHALMNGRIPSEEIPVEFIQAAIILTKYYAQQVQSLYTQFSDSDALAPHLVNVIQLAQRKGGWIKASDVYLSITKKHRPSGSTVREWFSELVVIGKGEVKGEGRTLQFRVFSDKHPPTPPSSNPPPLSNPPSMKLDEIRQELDKSSNCESTIYQGSQEKLDKLDKLDDFPKIEIPSVAADEEELDINQDGGVSSVEKNQILDELSNLSNNSQDDQLVGNTALDDLSKESSNLDNQQKLVAEAIASEEVAQPIETTLEEQVAALASNLVDDICPNKEELAVERSLYSREVLNNTEAQPQPEEIQVGDRVLVNCWPHADRLGPYQIERIEGEYAKVEGFAKLILLIDLRRA